MRHVYWWGDQTNFGDLLNVTLLEHFGIEYVWSKPRDADLLVCGSYLDGHDERCGGPKCRYHLPWQGWTGTIVGTGRLFAGRQPQDLSQARIYAVRGPLTAAEFGLDVPYADPGLLAPMLTGSHRKRWPVSYVPHWSDSALLDEAHERRAHVIDVRRTAVVDIAREIAESREVVASSLHGVIVADAFGVPAEPRLARRSREREGGDFKWRDYHASLDLEPDFGVMRTVPRERVAQMAALIESALKEVAAGDRA
jgi:pyruvyltransferase